MKLLQKLSINYDNLANRFDEPRERAIFRAGIDAGRHEEAFDSSLKTFLQGLVFLVGISVGEYMFRKMYKNEDEEVLLEEYYDED